MYGKLTLVFLVVCASVWGGTACQSAVVRDPAPNPVDEEVASVCDDLPEYTLKLNGNSSVIQSPYYEIRFSQAVEQDARDLARHLGCGKNALQREFGGLADIDQLLKEHRPVAYLHEKPEKGIEEGSVQWQEREVHLLARSRYTRDCCGVTGGTFDDKELLTTVIHLYARFLMETLLEKKEEGWRDLRSAPRWFQLGYAEYIAARYADNPQRKTIALELMKQDPDRIQFGPHEVKVKGAYSAPYLLLLFFHEEYGRDKIQRVLMSKESSFAKAFTAEIAPYPELEEKFRKWLEPQM